MRFTSRPTLMVKKRALKSGIPGCKFALAFSLYLDATYTMSWVHWFKHELGSAEGRIVPLILRPFSFIYTGHRPALENAFVKEPLLSPGFDSPFRSCSSMKIPSLSLIYLYTAKFPICFGKVCCVGRHDRLARR